MKTGVGAVVPRIHILHISFDFLKYTVHLHILVSYFQSLFVYISEDLTFAFLVFREEIITHAMNAQTWYQPQGEPHQGNAQHVEELHDPEYHEMLAEHGVMSGNDLHLQYLHELTVEIRKERISCVAEGVHLLSPIHQCCSCGLFK